MSLLTELHKFLASKSSITDLTSTRLYQTHLPQSYDWLGIAVSMVKISEQHYENLTNSSGIVTCRVQIDVWDTDEDAVDDCAEAIRLILQSYSGPIGDLTCLGVTLDDVNWLPEEPTDDSSQWRQHAAMDFLITVRNTVAPIN